MKARPLAANTARGQPPPVKFAKDHYRGVKFRTDQGWGGVAGLGARARSVTEGLAGAELAVICGLISSLFDPRTPKSIVMYRWSRTGEENHLGQPCTWIPNPEKRKVGGSPRP